MAKKKKSRKWLIIALLLALVSILSYIYIKSTQKPKGTEVTTEKVKKRTIKETVSASGRIFPETEVAISSDVSGEIVNLYVEEGDSVVIGQVLAKIDPELYVSSVERGQAGLSSAKAQIAIARTQLENSQAQKEQIVAQLENAKTVHERNAALLKDGVISKVEFDQTKASLDGLLANLKAADASIKTSQENIKATEFTTQSSEASLKELKTSLNRTVIKAPSSGTISSLMVEQGERVVGTMQMTGTEMMRIANLNTMEVQVEVSENDILKVEMNDEVDVEVDAYLDKIFKGQVTEIANSAANTSSIGGVTSLNTDQVTNFIVKIRLDPGSYAHLVASGAQYPFRPGMSASVDIYTERADNVISVPIQAVTVRAPETEDEDDSESNDDDENEDAKDSDLKEVVFLFEADTARVVDVTTGIQDDKYIQILSGLTDSSEIVKGPYSAVSKELKNGSVLRKKEKDGKKSKK